MRPVRVSSRLKIDRRFYLKSLPIFFVRYMRKMDTQNIVSTVMI